MKVRPQFILSQRDLLSIPLQKKQTTKTKRILACLIASYGEKKTKQLQIILIQLFHNLEVTMKQNENLKEQSSSQSWYPLAEQRKVVAQKCNVIQRLHWPRNKAGFLTGKSCYLDWVYLTRCWHWGGL